MLNGRLKRGVLKTKLNYYRIKVRFWYWMCQMFGEKACLSPLTEAVVEVRQIRLVLTLNAYKKGLGL